MKSKLIIFSGNNIGHIAETFFTDYMWNRDYDSYAEWNKESQRIEVHINKDKSEQWQAQVKFQEKPVNAPGKYKVSFKMIANEDVDGISVKWQDDNDTPTVLYENQNIFLIKNNEYEYSSIVEAYKGNGIIVFDFGWASKNSIIEIYDICIEKVEVGNSAKYEFYLVSSLNNWNIIKQNNFLFKYNGNGEYEVKNIKLTKTQGISVVAINKEDNSVKWIFDKNEYIVESDTGIKNIKFILGDELI